MADTRKITIEILSSSGEIDERIGQLESKFDKILSPKKNAKNNKKSKEEIDASKYFIHKAYDQALKLVLQTANTSISRYFSLSEDYISESTYKNIISSMNKGKNLALTAVSGAVIGSKVGGVIGGGVGATIAVVGWVGSELIQNQASLSSYYQSINATNMQTQFSRTRAGLVDNGRGTEN